MPQVGGEGACLGELLLGRSGVLGVAGLVEHSHGLLEVRHRLAARLEAAAVLGRGLGVVLAGPYGEWAAAGGDGLPAHAGVFPCSRRACRAVPGLFRAEARSRGEDSGFHVCRACR
jgi:hypothetical protein